MKNMYCLHYTSSSFQKFPTSAQQFVRQLREREKKGRGEAGGKDTPWFKSYVLQMPSLLCSVFTLVPIL